MRRLSFKEQQELATLPEQIDARETEKLQLFATLADPSVLRDTAALATARARLAAVEQALSHLTSRWEALETIAAESAAAGH